jgi:glycosyltransferase 2 family protein
LKRPLSIALGLALLALIYSQLDLAAFRAAFLNCDPLWLLLSLSMVVPLTLITALRFLRLSRNQLQFGESIRLILVAGTLNLVLPSKMGDIAKAYFLQSDHRYTGGDALAIVVFEKSFDMLALFLWFLVGFLFLPSVIPWFYALLILAGSVILIALLVSRTMLASIRRVLGACLPRSLEARTSQLLDSFAAAQGALRRDTGRTMNMGLLSLFLWLLHLLQIAGFTLAIGAEIPFEAQLALAPACILAGLLPLTFAGIGTRDAAVIILYAPYLEPPAAAVLGMLMTCRYLLPGVIGIPLLDRYTRRLSGRKPSVSHS